MYIKRAITDCIFEASQKYPIIMISGPRQSGKTTLVQTIFPDHRYISLGDPSVCEHVLADPCKFLVQYSTGSGVILDEIQQLPELLLHMRAVVDSDKSNGKFIVVGDQDILCIDTTILDALLTITAVFTLLPLSLSELENASLLPQAVEVVMYQGFYPKVYAEDVAIDRLYNNYLRLYVEHDIRRIKQRFGFDTFQRFMVLLVKYIGQVLNVRLLSEDLKVDVDTINAWVELLEQRYIIALFHKATSPMSEGLMQNPKLYFIDTGLACSLLKIRSVQDLSSHYLYDEIFKSMIIADFLKQEYHRGSWPCKFFKREYDFPIINDVNEESGCDSPVKIVNKSIAFDEKYFEELFVLWRKRSYAMGVPRYVVHAGDGHRFVSHSIEIAGWRAAGNLIKKLKSLEKVFSHDKSDSVIACK